MDTDAQLKLTFRLVPADGRPADSAVLDDIIRLIRQGVATAPKVAPTVTAPAEGFRPPTNEENRDLRSLESKIENRIQEASAASQEAVAKRTELTKQPDAEQRLAADALRAAEQLVSAVRSAMLRGVVVGVSEGDTGRS